MDGTENDETRRLDGEVPQLKAEVRRQKEEVTRAGARCLTSTFCLLPFFSASLSFSLRRRLRTLTSFMSNPIILALDVPNAEKALTLVEELAHVVGAFKIGSELFTTAGPDIVRTIRSIGASVFLDLKFHDIPHTVAKSPHPLARPLAAAPRLDVQMLSIHACGGLEMLRAAEGAAHDTARNLGRPAPLVLGVTVLTSMEADELGSVGVLPDLDKQVER